MVTWSTPLMAIWSSRADQTGADSGHHSAGRPSPPV